MADTAISHSRPSKAGKKGGKRSDTANGAVPTNNESAVASPAADIGSTDDTQDVDGNVNGASDGAYESPYIRELQKNIRNVNKKLAATQKVDSILMENPNMSLDELVTARKINNDQKAQALKKPSLQAALVQLEQQVVQYKKLEEDFQARARDETETAKAAHEKELEIMRTGLMAEMASTKVKDLRARLLVLSQFLRAAAARRQLEDDTSEESKGFEGVLLLLYGGDEAAVDAAVKLINGSDDGVLATDGTTLKVSYDRIKQMSLEYAPYPTEGISSQDVVEADQAAEQFTTADSTELKKDGPEDTQAVNKAADETDTDPTVANAGLTESSSRDLVTGVEMSPVIASTNNVIASQIDSAAANAAATKQWENSSTPTADSLGEGWISIPRDPAETETAPGLAAPSATHNWADETPEPSVEAVATPAIADDGFHEVHHTRGGRGRGGFEGRGGHDGRGGRGRGGSRGSEGAFRGRGGYRGDRGGEGRGRGRGRGGPRGRGEAASAKAAA